MPQPFATLSSLAPRAFGLAGLDRAGRHLDFPHCGIFATLVEPNIPQGSGRGKNIGIRAIF
jgi:hypothetical protein